ncbi:uncharacterized protein LOC125946597 [Dermacentor silvarum]|uniref:uncharacterized protein LOC125946597 n=1 Tax=Dermacentor silvarum TaxID=543639 RepID=UPI002101BA3B|nr:uncharacterized protein LOC125946597 [Dermacentor silvarum]
MRELVKLEGTLIDAARGRQLLADDHRNAALGVHAADFDVSCLSPQFLLILSILSNVESLSIESISKTLQAKSEQIDELLNQVVKQMQLFSVSVYTASAERSFSALCRIKTYLRDHMTQRRLTHLTLHVHKERTAKLNLEDVIKEFVTRAPERTATFGL